MKKKYDFLMDDRYGFLDGTPVEYMTAEKSKIAVESVVKIREFAAEKGKRPSELTEEELREFCKFIDSEKNLHEDRFGL